MGPGGFDDAEQIVRSLPAYLFHNVYWGGVMFRNYLLTAFRAIKKQKAFTFINVFDPREVIVIGFVMRRLTQLGWGPWATIGTSAIVRGSYHLYQGPAGVITATVTGVVYAVSFCLFRRLWPVWLAHVIWNMIPW